MGYEKGNFQGKEEVVRHHVTAQVYIATELYHRCRCPETFMIPLFTASPAASVSRLLLRTDGGGGTAMTSLLNRVLKGQKASYQILSRC